VRLSHLLNEGNAFSSRLDGLGFHYLEADGLILAGGFPDFGRRPSMFLRGLDAKKRSRFKYIVFDLTAITSPSDESGRMTPQQEKESEAGYCVLLKDANHVVTGLIDIVLKPAFRGRGIGRRIIDALKAGSPTDFDVMDVRKSSHGFWKKMGGRPVGHDKNWIIPK
jgi:ribosomal protein S18 acetylase RimI-like enzyme